MTSERKQTGHVLFNLQQRMVGLMAQRDRLALQDRLNAEKKKAIEDELMQLDREIADATS